MSHSRMNAVELGAGRLVKLLADIPGSIEDDNGNRVPSVMAKGNIVQINEVIPFLRPTTRTSLSAPLYQHAHSFRSEDGGLWMSDYVSAEDVSKTDTIPHTILSPSPEGLPEPGFYSAGRLLFLLEPYEYVSCRTGVRENLDKGDRIFVTSNMRRTIRGGSPQNAVDSLYCYDRAIRHGGPKVWMSDHFYTRESAFIVGQL